MGFAFLDGYRALHLLALQFVREGPRGGSPGGCKYPNKQLSWDKNW